LSGGPAAYSLCLIDRQMKGLFLSQVSTWVHPQYRLAFFAASEVHSVCVTPSSEQALTFIFVNSDLIYFEEFASGSNPEC
jgi:hypothetical protein